MRTEFKSVSLSKEVKSNLHTHTIFCDGKNTPRENIEAALEKGFYALGFSAHSLYPFSREGNVTAHNDGFTAYKKEILSLKEEFKGKIDIYFGFEGDFLPGITRPDFALYKDLQPEFLIGSVHYFCEREDLTGVVDNTPDELVSAIKRIYGGDVKKAVGAYFSLEREMLKKPDFTIMGHPDLIRKFNRDLKLFDEGETWYQNEIKETVKAIKKSGVIVEINTGAMSRGWTDSPYPSEYFLRLLNEAGVPVTISADAHQAVHLDYAFDFAAETARKAGYKEIMQPA